MKMSVKYVLKILLSRYAIGENPIIAFPGKSFTAKQNVF